MYSTVSRTGLCPSVIMMFVTRSNSSKLLKTKCPAHTAILTCSGICCKGGQSTSGGSSKHQITYKPYVPPCYRDHDHKNMTMRRPMSPHLTIYAPTFTAFTSICQRITGSIITFYALLISGGTLFLSNGVETYVSIIQSMDLSRPMLFIIKLLIGIPFSLHYFFGIRYALWNTGRTLQIKQVYDIGKKAIIAGAVMAFLFAIM